MATAALYHWKVPGSPVTVYIELPIVDRLREFAAASQVEVGGVLFGHLNDGRTIISGFEPVESEHRRGNAYTLSHRDQSRLQSVLQTHGRRHPGESAVGFFRSHLRPGMYLDEGDNHIVTSYFSSPSEVVLLVKPASDGSALGGFFFWEDGEMNRKQTYLAFPMNSSELESGSFPVVNSTPAKPELEPEVRGLYDRFGSAPTLDGYPIPDLSVPPPELRARPNVSQTSASQPSASQPSASQASAPQSSVAAAVVKRKNRTSPWVVFAVIAGLAALIGYIVGTSHDDQFGARPGDIAINTAPEQPTPPKRKPPPVATQPAVPPPVAAEPARVQPTAPAPPTPVTGLPVRPVATIQKPSPMPKATRPVPVKPAVPATSFQPEPQSQPTVAENTPPAASPVPVQPQPLSSPGYVEHPPQDQARPFGYNVRPPVAPSALVSVDDVEDSTVRETLNKLAIFGRSHHSGPNYSPPQVLHSITPAVPAAIARELNGPVEVNVKLKVNREGRVAEVELLSRNAPRELARLAGDAAYDWQFAPARYKDRPIDADVIAHFQFRR